MNLQMLAAAIEAEVKWTEDHCEGRLQYRKAYIKALNLVPSSCRPPKRLKLTLPREATPALVCAAGSVASQHPQHSVGLRPIRIDFFKV